LARLGDERLAEFFEFGVNEIRRVIVPIVDHKPVFLGLVKPACSHQTLDEASGLTLVVDASGDVLVRVATDVATGRVRHSEQPERLQDPDHGVLGQSKPSLQFLELDAGGCAGFHP
jgi:hypothetical protein